MIQLDWPIFAFDLRLILWPIAACLAALWILKSLWIRRQLKTVPAANKWAYGTFRPWYVWFNVWLFPLLHLITWLGRSNGKVPAWLVRLGKRNPSI